ncbi:hypothetical protein AB0P02_01215 [Streptomyces griseoluteus]|uniref:hypothetical protein n=1 Tax=Streptomyces griseoluteus TaxID=29306 RepID=UPI00341FD5C2
MKIEVILRTTGQQEAVAGEAEAENWSEAQVVLPRLLRTLAEEIENLDEPEEDADASADA